LTTFMGAGVEVRVVKGCMAEAPMGLLAMFLLIWR